MSELLEAKGLSKSFAGVQALQDVSFSLRQGEVCALVGGNGAGKSTLVKILSGVHAPDAGSMILDGAQYSPSSPADARRQGVETVYQDLALVDTFDIAENFFLGKELTIPGAWKPLRVLRKREMRRRADSALRDLHVRIPGSRAATKSMSGGQRQAIAIARAAYWKNKVLLLDEPTAALGVEESNEVLSLIEQMAHERGSGLLMISHNIEDVWRVCERILVLRQGRMVADVRRDDVKPAEIVEYITGADAISVPTPDQHTRPGY